MRDERVAVHEAGRILLVKEKKFFFCTIFYTPGQKVRGNKSQRETNVYRFSANIDIKENTFSSCCLSNILIFSLPLQQ